MANSSKSKNTYGSFEAKTKFSSLLQKVARGEQIMITRHGLLIAKLVPVSAATGTERTEALNKLKGFCKGKRLNGLNLRSLIEEGRK